MEAVKAMKITLKLGLNVHINAMKSLFVNNRRIVLIIKFVLMVFAKLKIHARRDRIVLIIINVSMDIVPRNATIMTNVHPIFHVKVDLAFYHVKLTEIVQKVAQSVCLVFV